MKKYQKTILLNLFITIFLILPVFAVKAEINKPYIQVPIPTLNLSASYSCEDGKMCYPWIGEYIIGIYSYAIGIVGILATVILMFGGILWINSRGNQEKVGEAKAWIGAALSGLVLTLASFLILYIINPDLTQPKPIAVKKVGEAKIIAPAGSRYKNCQWKTGNTCKDPSMPDNLEKSPVNYCDASKKTYEGVGRYSGKTYTHNLCCCEILPLAGCSWKTACVSKEKESDVANCGSVDHEDAAWKCCCPLWNYDPGIEKQLGDISEDLDVLLNCMRGELPIGIGRISSISDSKHIGKLTDCDKADCSNCTHACQSCHYGGGTNSNKSYAVDFGDEENKILIKNAAKKCGAGFILDEGNHIHVSSKGCPRK